MKREILISLSKYEGIDLRNKNLNEMSEIIENSYKDIFGKLQNYGNNSRWEVQNNKEVKVNFFYFTFENTMKIIVIE